MRRSITVVSLALTTHFCSHADPTGGTAPSAAPAPTEAAQANVAPSTEAPATPTYAVPIDGLPVLGSDRALVTIVAFTDYQCPFCKRADATVARLRAEYGDDLRVVLASRPLPMHDRARPAALAALAADRQGKIDALHGRLFALATLDDASIEGAAKAAGLDMDRFARDRAEAPAQLARSEKLADELGVRGTPSFFVNGKSVLGAQPYEVFKRVVDERMTAARALVASGVRREDVYPRSIAGGLGKLVVEDDDEGGTCAGGHACDGKDGPAVGDKVETVRIDGSPVHGALAAPVTIVEFGDYECPFSSRVQPTLRALEQAHGGAVRIVFKSRPLPFHEHARLAAKAAMAADAQGKFWPMHERLYAAHGALDRAELDGVARELGMDVARFDRDLDDPRTEARIAADEADAEALKVRGTPTFFVNGHRVVGAQPTATFEAAIAAK